MEMEKEKEKEKEMKNDEKDGSRKEAKNGAQEQVPLPSPSPPPFLSFPFNDKDEGSKAKNRLFSSLSQHSVDENVVKKSCEEVEVAIAKLYKDNRKASLTFSLSLSLSLSLSPRLGSLSVSGMTAVAWALLFGDSRIFGDL